VIFPLYSLHCAWLQLPKVFQQPLSVLKKTKKQDQVAIETITMPASLYASAAHLAYHAHKVAVKHQSSSSSYTLM